MKKKGDPLQEIASITQKFLRGNGGLGNGYLTYVSGSVDKHGGHIDWSVPNRDNYTGFQLKNMADKFMINVRRVLISHDIYEVRFEIRHIEHGAFETTVYEVSKPLTISLGM